MTWRELAAAIAKRIPPENLDDEVLYHEPYDEDAATLPVELAQAESDIGKDSEGEVMILAGRFYLA